MLVAAVSVAQDLYVRGAHNSWAANAADKMTQVEPGIYTISNYTLTGAFKIADASWSATANWGAAAGGSSLVVPGTPLTVEQGQLFFLAWNISVTSGTNCAGAPGLALDDVVLTPQVIGSGVEAMTTTPADTQKIFRNGQLLIVRNRRTYNIFGAEQ